MLVETFTVGMLSTNCYIASSQKTKEAIIIDPGIDFPTETKQIFDYVSKNELKIKLILNTHGHADHISGNAMMQDRYKVPIYIHRLDKHVLEGSKETLPPVLLEEGSPIDFGDESLKVMHTPGHTPGSICLIGNKLVFTGDTLFAQGIGRTDFPEGSDIDMRSSLQKLRLLPDYLLIYPGHGSTSIMGEEKRINPWLSRLGI